MPGILERCTRVTGQGSMWWPSLAHMQLSHVAVLPLVIKDPVKALFPGPICLHSRVFAPHGDPVSHVCHKQFAETGMMVL